MIYYNRVSERGYAKINLHLDITGRLEGGFHSVATVMQTVSIFDEVTVFDIEESSEARFTASCNIEGVPTDEKNLAVKAALAFCQKAGVSLRGKIDIQKNIPMAAGMAGGSADGAAVLRALNKALGDPLTVKELCSIGSSLGSDVPFCIVGGTAYADGKGDILHPFPEMPACVIVAACEGEGVSTPWAYRLLDGLYSDFTENCGYESKNTEPLKSALASGNIKAVSDNMYNIFEEPVLKERPVASEIKRLMLEAGAVGAMMSGSGPSVFGIFACEKCGERAGALLESRGYKAHICRPSGKFDIK